MTKRTRLPKLIIAAEDADRLWQLGVAARRGAPALADFLERELDRATVVARRRVPPSVVQMESRVTYRDEASGREREIHLVYPEAADLEAGRISVLTPVGAALIGVAAGDSIDFETPSGEARRLTVVRVEGAAGTIS